LRPWARQAAEKSTLDEGAPLYRVCANWRRNPRSLVYR